jgi:uncharacterized protein YndB with AHSA1/START domain
MSPRRERLVGQTKRAGFEIGARKTFAVSPARAWEVITSRAGLKLWLGDSPDFCLEAGATYHTHEGAQGEVRVVNPGRHFRLTWQPAGWAKASLLQVRVLPSGSKTAISFHQEHLRGPKEREQMRRRWQTALDQFQTLINPSKEKQT